MMKSTLISLFVLISISISSNTLAEHSRSNDNEFIDYARVIHVEPIYKKHKKWKKREVCRKKEIRRRPEHHSRHDHDRHDHNAEKVLIGGLLGGLVGHNVGSSHNRNFTTFSGTVIGSAIGYEIAQSDRHRHRDQDEHWEQVSYVEHCETVNRPRHRKHHIKAYRVSYRYKGEIFTTRMKTHPGKRIKIHVQVHPVSGRYY